MDCRHCGSGETVRNGRHAGVQRYRCRSCGRYFRESEPKFGKAVEARALDMYLNNVGIRKIARFTGVACGGAEMDPQGAQGAERATRASCTDR